MNAIDGGRSLEALEERSGSDLWQRVFDAIEDPIFIQDAGGVILRANRAAGLLFGLPPEALAGRFCYEVVHGTARFIEGCPFVRSWTSRRREIYTLFMHDRWYRVSIDPLLDAERQVIGAIHIISDVSQIKEIDELRSHLAAILETSEDAIVGTTLDGRILSMNAAAKRLFGRAEGGRIGDFVPDARNEEWDAACSQVKGGGAGRRFESWIVVSGEEREISVGISPVLDERGISGGLSYIIHDLSAQRRAERALVAYVTEASLRMKVPIGGVSGEIDRVTALLESGAIAPQEAVAILKVQKTHLDQIARNLADIDRAVARSDVEIPEAYRRYLAGS